MDAAALRQVQEPAAGAEWEMRQFRVDMSRLQDLLEDLAEEVEALWQVRIKGGKPQQIERYGG